MTVQPLGAIVFGLVIGWSAYYIMHHVDKKSVSDLVVVVEALGGALILNLFPSTTGLFGWYAIGLGIGFFGYFFVVWLTKGNPPTYKLLTGRMPP